MIILLNNYNNTGRLINNKGVHCRTWQGARKQLKKNYYAEILILLKKLKRALLGMPVNLTKIMLFILMSVRMNRIKDVGGLNVVRINNYKYPIQSINN